MFTTLISPSELATLIADGGVVAVDCRFNLADTSEGERLYLEGHIPNACYAHLDRDLSGAKTGSNGRHPLPSVEEMRERFGALGIADDLQVVAYDADTGMYAARLWWMLRFMGHHAAAVLDGGLARWTAEGYALAAGRSPVTPRRFAGKLQEQMRVDAGDIARGFRDAQQLLVDARAEDRFRGENETIDARAGHIPGARNFFFQRNLTADKRFKPAAELRAQWKDTLGVHAPRDAVVYCGSGVTACHNLLALEHAELPGARLYPGSWSEWSSDPSRPVATDRPE